MFLEQAPLESDPGGKQTPVSTGCYIMNCCVFFPIYGVGRKDVIKEKGRRQNNEQTVALVGRSAEKVCKNVNHQCNMLPSLLHVNFTFGLLTDLIGAQSS